MPVFWLIVACALWGLSFPVVKALHLEQSARMPGVSSVFLASWMQVARFGLAALMLYPLVARRAKPTRNELIQGAQLGLWGGLGMFLQADGLAYTEASTSAFLTQAYCVILPLAACLKTRRAPGLRIIGATLLVILGGSILSGVRPDHLKLGRGELETIAAAFLFTFQILALENPRYTGNRGTEITLVMCVVITLLFLPVTFLTAPSPAAVLTAGASVATWSLVFVLTSFCTLGAYLLMNIWQPRVSSTEAGLIYTIEPVFTAAYCLFLPAWLGRSIGRTYPNETLTRALLIGGALIVCANLLMQWKRPPHDPTIAPAP